MVSRRRVNSSVGRQLIFFGFVVSVKHSLIFNLGLLLAGILTMSCHSRSSSFDCNFSDDAQDCPHIVVDADGVEINLFDDHANVNIDKLRDYLSQLPRRYWRNGKVVVISEGGFRPPHSDDLIHRNKEQTIQIVESLGLRNKCAGRNVVAALPPMILFPTS
jgi:hypothetical protein